MNAFDRPLFRGEQDKIYRVALVCPRQELLAKRVHFHKDTGFFMCKSGRNWSGCCSMLGKPRWRVGTVIAVYNTDNEGNVRHPVTSALRPWIFGESTYSQLRELIIHPPINDLKLVCTKRDYQQWNIASMPKSYWEIQERQASIQAKIEELKTFIEPRIGKNLSKEEIIEALGGVEDEPDNALSEALKQINKAEIKKAVSAMAPVPVRRKRKIFFDD